MAAEEKEAEKQKRKFFSRGKVFFLAVVLFYGLLFWMCFPMVQGLRMKGLEADRRSEISSAITSPIEGQYEISAWYVGLPVNGAVTFEIILKDAGQAFDIVREIAERKRLSPYLDKEFFEITVKIKDDTGFRVQLPGASGYTPKRNMKMYWEMHEKWQKILQEREKTASGEAKP